VYPLLVPHGVTKPPPRMLDCCFVVLFVLVVFVVLFCLLGLFKVLKRRVQRRDLEQVEIAKRT
jgi:hypothetical protein